MVTLRIVMVSLLNFSILWSHHYPDGIIMLMYENLSFAMQTHAYACFNNGDNRLSF